MLDYVQFFRKDELVVQPKMLRKKSSGDAPTSPMERESKHNKAHSSLLSRHLSFSSHRQKESPACSKSNNNTPSCDSQSPQLQRNAYVNCSFGGESNDGILAATPPPPSCQSSYHNMRYEDGELVMDSPNTTATAQSLQTDSEVKNISELPNRNVPEVANPYMNYVMLDLRPSTAERNRPLSMNIPDNNRRSYYCSSHSFQENDLSFEPAECNSLSISPNLNYVRIFPERVQSNISASNNKNTSLKSLNIISTNDKLTDKDPSVDYAIIDFEKTTALNGALEEFENYSDSTQKGNNKTGKTPSKKKSITKSFRSIGRKKDSLNET